MKPFEELTDRGRQKRLHALARQALERYDLDIARLRIVAEDTNTTFRLDTVDRRRYAFRVGAAPSDTLVDPGVEIAFLLHLADDPTVEAVRPHPNVDGGYVTVVEYEGVPEPRNCVLFDWLSGKPIGSGADVDDYRKLGELSARLHAIGDRWRPPPDTRPAVWDRVFYYSKEPIVLYDARYSDLMTPERVDVVSAVATRCEEELGRLHREVPVQICHGDLHPWNVMRYRGRLVVFDFEDLMLAAPVQDIAISLFYNRTHPDYESLRRSFEAGYGSLRPWPVEWDGQLELLMAARTVMFINYVLRLDLDPEEYVPMAVDRIAQVLG